jgi:L,D-transpeptidase ErfK/SrfK
VTDVPYARPRVSVATGESSFGLAERRVFTGKKVLGAVTCVLVLGLVAAGLQGSRYAYTTLPVAPELPAVTVPDGVAPQRFLQDLRSKNRGLETKLASKVPRGIYIVIDQTHNRLYLKSGDKIVLDARCSAGSGMVLRESGGGGRVWVFDTPRGPFRVLQKMKNPVWKKPDWAFVEEGQPIPKDPSERFEYGALGEYALYFGNGYMIHGTLYERLLGRSVTHGCIRLGRDDLRVVYKECPVGTKIYIY